MTNIIRHDVETELTRHRDALSDLKLITKILFAQGDIDEIVKDQILGNLSNIANDPLQLICEYIGQKIEVEQNGKKFEIKIVKTEV